jgi:hypothetical protein
MEIDHDITFGVTEIENCKLATSMFNLHFSIFDLTFPIRAERVVSSPENFLSPP